MTASELRAELARRGIRLDAYGDRLRYAPRSAVTPELAERIKVHKTELLAALRGDFRAESTDPVRHWWHAALDEVKDHFPAQVLQALREADVEFVTRDVGRGGPG